MDGRMAISSLLSEAQPVPFTLEQCTVEAPGQNSNARAAYMSSQLARFQQIQEWQEQHFEADEKAFSAAESAKWAKKAELAAALAWPHLKPRAASRSAQTAPPTKKRKLEKDREIASKKSRETDSEPPEDMLDRSSLTSADGKASKKGPMTAAKQYKTVYESIWRDISRKEIPKAFKLYQNTSSTKYANAKKTVQLASKEARRWQFRTNKHVKDLQSRARRAMREMMAYWKRNEKEERDLRKKAEKEAMESAKREEEERESQRQAKKLNFLITQTELYSHFVGSKIDSTAEETASAKVDFDADEESLKNAASANAQKAVLAARQRALAFDASEKVRDVNIDSEEMNFQNPTSLGDMNVTQPKLLSCQLKEYQLKGLNWLANLYEQGINGILADEMGLGKTVQSISVMAYLAEVHNIWGPFLVIAPASTLHNWQQEITKFVPEFKVLPYWGNFKDRKVLRKFWDRKQLRYTKDSPFHVLVTSYQLVVADAQYFNRIKWQYMILDEAQAIKSSSSSRWKSLLSMQCRNRLLLTGTPIQNSMQELWALLHFIMPTLFDSHEEFSDWFSKDIESHATKNSQLNEQQLKRLHMILKPFMLRRVKKNVQRELGDKIEIDVYCKLSRKQRELYNNLKSQISVKELLESSESDTQNLMNLVMQFRKVCNHPELFERAEVKSPLTFGSFGNTVYFAREGPVLYCPYSVKNLIEYRLPKQMYRAMVPGDDANFNPRLERMLSIWNPESTSIKSAEFLSGTPAGKIVQLARNGLLERAVGLYDISQTRMFEVEDVLAKLGHVGRDYVQSSCLRNYESSYLSAVKAPPIQLVGSDRSLTMDQQRALCPPELDSFSTLTLNQELWFWKNGGFSSFPPSNLYPDGGPQGYSSISMPSMARFIADSGKLRRLDTLLADLKANDHKVLIYFQMTKMMDLMEEYLTYRQYKYLRLDGSSKLGDRRDLVNDWQTKPELFVFLLSTRAGGLGINLTAADTVIFYDSDWNPTIDSQAMDRAHRLGQTRQVTVYRLLVRGTIEERMRKRAKQKEHVQQVVMEGNGKAKDIKPAGREVAYWLLDEDDSAADDGKDMEIVSNTEEISNTDTDTNGSIRAESYSESPKIEEIS